MPVENIQTNFTSGELDPLLSARMDAKAYYNGAARLRNIIVIPQGGARRRPGLEYVDTLPKVLTRLSAGITATAPQGGTAANANDDDTATEVITTGNISTTNPYVVVHYDLGSAKAIDFVDVVGFKITAGSLADEFVIQYSTDNITFTTLGDPVPATTADRHRRVFGPITARYWRFARVGATDLGTAKAQIDEFILWQQGALSASRLPSFEFSTDAHYQFLFTDKNCRVYKNGIRQADVATPYAAADLALINWTQSLDTMIIVHRDYAPRRMIRQGGDDQWQVDLISFTNVPRHAFDLVENSATGQTLTPSAVSGTVVLTAGGGTLFSAASVGQFVDGNGGRARIVKYTSATVVTAITIFPFYDTGAIASGSWTLETGYEDAWSATRGWPQAVAFHDGRLALAGTPSLPSTIWLSRSNLFFDFDLGQNLDDDAIEGTIAANDVPEIVNLYSGRTLQIFTSSGERYIPQDVNTVLTPSTFSIKLATSRGAKAGLRPVEVSGATLFVQRQGKALREFLFGDVEQNYSSNNISLLSSHLIVNPVDIALRRSTNTDEADLVPLVNTDGTLAVLTTLREQEVTAFTLCTTAGLFKQVGVDQSDIYFVVERTVNSATVRYLEKFNELLFTDAAVYYDSGMPLSALTGLDHLEGEEVEIILDGAVQPADTVASGSVTLVRDATATAQAGLDFTTEVLPMPITLSQQSGGFLARKKHVQQVEVELFETTNLVIDGQEVAFTQFGPAGGGSPLDAAVVPFTGRKRINGMTGWDQLAQLPFTQSVPAPLTITGINMRVQV